MTVAEARIGRTEALFKLATPGAHFALSGVLVLAAAEAAGADIALGNRARPRALGAAAGRGAAERLSLDPVEDWSAKLIDRRVQRQPPLPWPPRSTLLALTAPRGQRGPGLAGDAASRSWATCWNSGSPNARCTSRWRITAGMATVDRVHCVGPLMAALWEALPAEKRGLRAEKCRTACGPGPRALSMPGRRPGEGLRRGAG